MTSEFQIQYILVANAHKAWSNSKLGPVTPKMIIGQPENNDHKIPANDEKIIVSVIPIRAFVVSSSTPPNAMAPERQAKKMKLAVAITCESSPSLKSEM